MADVVVLLPGITGSVLRDSAGRDVWAPTAGAAARALVTLGRSLAELELRDPDADDGVTAPLMVPDLHLIPGLWKIDGYSRLSGYLQREFAVTPGRNFFTFPYDWRRDNRVAARRLKEQADRWLREWRRESPDAKLVLVGHSMGGLVARYFLECLGGWRDTRRLVTFGTPYRGSLNALDFLVHGMQKKLGPVPVLDLSRLLRSFPSIYQLLPIYPCLDRGDGQLIRVSEAAGLPHVDQERARAADGFHREIEQAVTAHLDDEEYRRGRYAVHPIVGTFQATLLSARRSGDGVQVLRTFPGFVPDGDGTVPRVSATPVEFAREEGAMFAAERHGSLQHNDGVLVQLAGLLSGQDTSAVRAGANAGIELDDAFGPGEPVGFRFRAADPMASLTVVVTDARTGAEVARVELGAAGEWRGAELAPPPPGAYRITLAGDGVEPVTDTFVVVGEQDPAGAGETRGGDRRVRGGEPVVVSQAPPVRRSDDAVSRPDSSVFDDEEPGTGGFPSAPGKPHTADVNVAADMPSQLQVGKVASVTCRVSRDEIDAAAGRARADGRIAADPSRRITLEVLPKANVEVVGEDRADVPVPGVAETSDAYFDIRPTDIGICQVWVVVRQGPVPLLTLRLEAPAALEPQAVPIARYPVEAKVAVGVATGLEDGTWLSVVEMERGPDAVYRYELRSTTLKILATFESPPLRHRAEYVANLYREIENRWLTSNGDVEAFQEELREFGGTLLSQLFPERLQEILWRLRDSLKDLIVLSCEPFIPWELVHLKEPGGPLPDETRFLAETGLVRWLYTRDNAYPPPTLYARPGRVRVLCPDYPDPAMRLPQTRAEADFLIASLGASEVPAHEREVRALLRAGDFDILHFAGHGQADGNDIANAKIHLEGRMEGRTYVASTVSATTVDQQARLAGSEGSKPLVVLNACQAGRVGQQMSSLGGFAQAFLERGAGAFISTMWSVGDEPSSTFVTTFYRELLRGQPISAAASRARQEACKAGDGTWLAYAVYANPQAHLLTSGPAAPGGGV